MSDRNHAGTLMANLCLVVAALLLLPIAVMVFEARPVSGEYAVGLVLVPLLEVLQWLALTGALLIAAHRGRLAWLHHQRSVQAIVGGVWLGFLSVAATMVILTAYGPSSASFRLWSVMLALVVPAVTIVALAVHINSTNVLGSASGWRAGATVLSLVIASCGFAMLQADRAKQGKRDIAQATEDSARSAWETALHRKFDALSPDAALAEWLPWLDVSDDALQKQALATVRRRPTLNRDVAAMLQSDHASLALRFLWLWMPSPPVELAAPTRDAIANLSTWSVDQIAKQSAVRMDQAPRAPEPVPSAREVTLDDMAQAAIVLADAFRSSGLDFVTPIRAFASTLQRHALPDAQFADDVTYQPRAYIDTWLKSRSHD